MLGTGLIRGFIGRLPESTMARRIGPSLLRSPLAHNPAYAFAHRKYMEHRMAVLQARPQTIAIENTNHCNYRCVICTHPVMMRPKGFMDMDLFKRIIDEAVDWGITTVGLAGFGEPLLDPHYIDKLRYAKSGGVPFLHTTSNGSVLKEQVSHAFVDEGLDALTVSLDAATADTYARVRAPGRLDLVEQNILELIRYRDSQGKKAPRVTVVMEATARTYDEAALFREKWHGKVDAVKVGFVHNWAGGLDDRELQAPADARWEWAREPCAHLWTSLNISWDGRVKLCCLDYENAVSLGDVKTQTMREVWEGAKLKAIREAHMKGQFGAIDLCGDCTMRTVWWLS